MESCRSPPATLACQSLQSPPLSAGHDSMTNTQDNPDDAATMDRHIRVLARIRPMNPDEAKRGSERGVKILEMTTEEELDRLPNASRQNPDDSMSSLEDLDQGILLDDTIVYDTSNNDPTTLTASNNTLPTIVIAESSSGQRQFTLDGVFGPHVSQQFVYEQSLDNMAQHLFQGYNTTILAYGQTGSGKTYTMGGQKDARTLAGESDSNGSIDLDGSDEQDGIIPRAVRDIFRLKHEYEDQQYTVQVQLSCLEIYQDELRDLLVSGMTSPNAMKLRDYGNGVTVRGLQTFTVHSMDHVHSLMEQATLRRTTASTRLNERSSRSHAVCTISVTVAPPKTKHEAVVTAKLTLVDLAGSERIKDTGVVGLQQQESITINKDLFVLGKVVSALSERAKRGTAGHVPYRDSKLTRLLRDSLGGNCRTVLIACVSPADINVDESINTLRYAERSRKISNVVKQNRIQAEINPSEYAALRAENKRLRIMVAQLRNALVNPESTHSDVGVQLDGLQTKMNAAESEARSARDLSLVVAERARRFRKRLQPDGEGDMSSESVVSPLLSYELSMGIADDDLESLLDEASSVTSENGELRDADSLRSEIALLKDEKTCLVNELTGLRKEIANQRSYLSVMRTNIKLEEQKRCKLAEEEAGEANDSGDQVARELEQESTGYADTQSEIQELRTQLERSLADNEQVNQRNAELQQELQQLREQMKQEALKFEISQIERKIEKIQSSRALSVSSPSPAKVLKESTVDANKSDAPVTTSPCRSIKKRLLSVEFEDEKKDDDDPATVENNNPLQPLLDELSTGSSEKPYKDDADDSYVLPQSREPAGIDDIEVKPSGSSEDLIQDADTSKELKAKAEGILDAAEKIFDNNSSLGSMTASVVSSVGTFFIPGGDKDETHGTGGRIVISNIDIATKCTCEDSMFGGRMDHVDFYLPKLGVACTCGKGSPVTPIEGDPLALVNILRPWQCDFLASLDLYVAEDFIAAFKERGHAIAASMRRWRRSNGLLSVRTKSCVIALHIWSRTCRSVIRSVREQQARGVAKPERPDFLQISINHDARSVSTMGFGSVVETKHDTYCCL